MHSEDIIYLTAATLTATTADNNTAIDSVQSARGAKLFVECINCTGKSSS